MVFKVLAEADFWEKRVYVSFQMPHSESEIGSEMESRSSWPDILSLYHFQGKAFVRWELMPLGFAY